MRKLVIIPIIHGEEDSGSVREDVARAFRSRLGRRGWERHRAAVRAFWDQVGDRLRARSFDPARTRVYQDGLPVCGRERDMVRDLAAQGSANHRIVQALVEAGAEVMGTEDPALLLAEYERIKQQLAAMRTPRAGTSLRSRRASTRTRSRADEPTPTADTPVDPAAMTRSLAPRDAFIAGRIDETLGPDEVGVLFIGLMHDVAAHLPSDIEVEYLFERAEVLALTGR